ncbi:ORC4 [Auxenochlorella protothecoides x Auxenochlorella symbiontica]
MMVRPGRATVRKGKGLPVPRQLAAEDIIQDSQPEDEAVASVFPSPPAKRARVRRGLEAAQGDAEPPAGNTRATRGRAARSAAPAVSPARHTPGPVGEQAAQTSGLVTLSPPPQSPVTTATCPPPPSPGLLTTASTPPWMQRYAEMDPLEASTSFLTTRLQRPRSPEAATLALRPALQAVVADLAACLEGTASLGHAASLLLVGPRQSGKTLAVERALRTLCARHNWGEGAEPSVGVVRLAGWAHAEERTAFRDTARQLCEAFDCVFKRSASVGENIEFLREMLQCISRAQKTVVFVLDEFDAWARRPRQTLLYGLLDAISCSGVRAAVVGTTVRGDAVSLLEKRVRSRFSHRVLTVPRVGANEAPGVLRAWLEPPPGWPHACTTRCDPAAALAAPGVSAALRRAAARRGGLAGLAQAALALMTDSARRGGGAPPPGALAAALAAREAADGASQRALCQLSVLELILAVAAHRVSQRRPADALCFEQAHAEFRRFSNLRGQHVDGYTRGAALRALDALLALGVLSRAGTRANDAAAGGRQFMPLHLQVTPEELGAALAAHPSCPLALQEWFAKEGGLGDTANQMLG